MKTVMIELEVFELVEKSSLTGELKQSGWRHSDPGWVEVDLDDDVAERLHQIHPNPNTAVKRVCEHFLKTGTAYVGPH